MGGLCARGSQGSAMKMGGVSDEIRTAIRNALIDNAMFNEVTTQRNLSDADLNRVIGKFRSEEFEKDKNVFLHGDAADRCYFVWKGGVDVFSAAGIKLNKSSIGSGAIFGEIGFLHGSTRQASIITNKNSQLYYLTVNDFEAATSFTPNLEDLADVPILKSTLSPEQLERLSRTKMQTRSYRQKEYICSAATTAKNFYIIIRGNVRLSAPSMSMKEIEELGKYDYFGEIALINETEQVCELCAQAYSSGETTIALIEQETFDNDPDCAPLREFLKKRMKNARKMHHKRELYAQTKGSPSKKYDTEAIQAETLNVAETKTSSDLCTSQSSMSILPCNLNIFGGGEGGGGGNDEASRV